MRDIVGPAVAGPADVAVFLDPAVHQQLRNRMFDRTSAPYAGDDFLAPYVAIRDRLVASGLSVQTADYLPEQPDGRRHIIISFGTHARLTAHSVRKYRALARRKDVVLSAFFAMECPVVEPTLYEALPELRRYFRRIMSWSDSDSLLPFTRERVEVGHFCWPQSFDSVHAQLWSQRNRKFLLMMNANKLPRLYVNELYTARLRAIEYFHRFGEIDLYGRDWDRMPARMGKSRLPWTFRRLIARTWPLRQRLRPNPLYVAAAEATRGATRSKSVTLAQYRFALCFENSMVKGWMTEKLFDCFFAGTVPVYWGAPDVFDWVPSECFIDMRQFKDYAELRSFLHALTPTDEQRYREAARDFLASDQFMPFRRRTFADLIARIISADTGVAV